VVLDKSFQAFGFRVMMAQEVADRFELAHEADYTAEPWLASSPNIAIRCQSRFADHGYTTGLDRVTNRPRSRGQGRVRSLAARITRHTHVLEQSDSPIRIQAGRPQHAQIVYR
jgi:hypothetical protein